MYARTEEKTNFVRIEMESGESITLELYPDIAPITVENFKSLVAEGYYSGIIFHRVIAGFMIQGGDPMGIGIGGSGKNIKGEFAMNGFNNTIRHKRGVISMARAMHPDSAGSQFFIMHADSPHLDGQYAAFGKVVEGMNIVDEIASVPTDFRDRPQMDMRIKSITLVDETVEEPEKV